jgi:hypothetical protein
MRDDHMAVFQLDPERRIRQEFLHDAGEFERVFLGHGHSSLNPRIAGARDHARIARREVTEQAPAGESGFRILEAADLAPAGLQGFGVTLRSATAPVLVAAGARFTADRIERTGIVRYPGVPDADPYWTFGGTWEPGRTVALEIVNLSSEPARLVIDLRSAPRAGRATPDDVDGDGDAAPGTDGEAAASVVRGRRLEGPVVAPGAQVRFVLPIDTEGTWSADVWGGEALAVARSDVGRDRLEPVVVIGVPSRAWLAPIGALPGRQLDGWVGRLSTTTDLRPTPRPTAAMGTTER